MKNMNRENYVLAATSTLSSPKETEEIEKTMSELGVKQIG